MADLMTRILLNDKQFSDTLEKSKSRFPVSIKSVVLLQE